jgi:translation initiation factor 5
MENNNKIYLTSNELTTFDPSYRYKVSLPIFTKMVKKGTIVTIFDNCIEFAKSIEIDKNLLVRLIAIKLSCQVSLDKSTNKIYFKGNYESHTIIDIICEIIQNYLLCVSCDLPEVILKSKNHKIKQKCKACGASNYINIQHSNSQLYEIILHNLEG